MLFPWEFPPVVDARRQLPWAVATRLSSSSGRPASGRVTLCLNLPVFAGLMQLFRRGSPRKDAKASMGRGCN
eukprot:4307277-Pyramimonas_sp.AAC.1